MLLVAMMTAPAALRAMPARDTAAGMPEGATEIAVAGPLRHGLTPTFEVSTHPLVFLAAMNAAARVTVLAPGGHGWTLSLEPALSLPTMALSSPPPLGLEGYLTPSCAVRDAEPGRAPDDCERSGEVLAIGLGVAATLETWATVTARVDYTHGFLLTGDRAAPLDTWAPVDLLFAPVFASFRAHAGLRVDRSVTDWLRLAAELHVWRVGQGPVPGRDPHTYGAHIGTDWATSPATRLTLGVMYWNSDQRRRRLVEDADGYSRYEAVRSHDVWPTLDFIARFGN
jgi:hypothetical protein